MRLEIDEIDARFITNILCRAQFVFESLGSDNKVCAENRDSYREDAKIAKQARGMLHNAIRETKLAELKGETK